MNQAIAAEWVAALRSGKYAQTKEQLVGNGGYCCLGVLCDISKQGEWFGGFYECGYDHENGRADESNTELPTTVTAWAGMRDSNGRLPFPEFKSLSGGTEFLSLLNDRGATFSEIADIIEQHWEAL